MNASDGSSDGGSGTTGGSETRDGGRRSGKGRSGSGRGASKGGQRRRGGTGKRRRAREMAVQMLYQLEMGKSRLDQVFATFDVDDYLAEGELADETKPIETERQALDSFEYARRLVEGTLREAAAIDDLIRAHAENWRLERMPAIDRNILRLALYEMLHETSVPKVVIVDEAIELAKKYGSENSGRFVNGLLDGVLKSRTPGSRRDKNADGGAKGRPKKESASGMQPQATPDSGADSGADPGAGPAADLDEEGGPDDGSDDPESATPVAAMETRG